MKKVLLFTFALLLFGFQSFSQLLSWSPGFIQESSTPVVITVDATKGNHGLLNYTPVSDVYLHIGVITNLSTGASDWKYVSSVWATTNPLFQATSLGGNRWSYTITGGLRSYDGQDFSTIAQIKAMGISNYSYVDNSIHTEAGVFYYRLKSFDKDVILNTVPL
ncbi:hypothetical protein FW778_08735 [Ginsengibacter hankyongi]|uniref:Uncharacterized protein n=1 Tax=Ginsengibacter hankyongi TaxID=2607284 RepID=A0A5J5IPY6_9BACT|nr:hypothetical protein [Ginsengibacter hankyongi]KAA9042087.1 hypothetical protein FW778_08735 [Ginsengibacter hankyongi]